MEPEKAQSQPRRARSLYQVTFSDYAMRELNSLPVDQQLALVEKISSVTRTQLARMKEGVGRFHRDGVTYFRVRAGDYRCYFEVFGDTLYAHYLLHRNSLTDFIYRNKLPATEETMIEQHQSFWKYLETLKKGGRE